MGECFLDPHYTGACGVFIYPIMYICFFPSFRMSIIVFWPLVKSLAIGQPYTLGTKFLAFIYQPLSQYVTEVLA